MNIEEAICQIEALKRTKSEPRLMGMRRALASLGSPEKGLKVVHVTGTNGKGSTCANIASIAQAAGYKVGLFTSPHLYRYNERIQIDGQEISDEDFCRHFEKVKTLQLGLFQTVLCMALLHFSEQKVDLAVVEVGIGGRMDSTNVLDSLVSVVTNVGLDHEALLGHTKKEVAHHKAGVIKPNSIAVIAEQGPDLREVFCVETAEKHVFLKEADIQVTGQNLHGQSFQFGEFRDFKTPLLGRHQVTNACTAILVAEALCEKGFDQINEQAIREGLESVKWPLRLELVHENPNIIIDAGHNPHGMRAVCESLQEITNENILIFGASYNKDYAAMLKELAPLSDQIILTKATYKGAEPEELARHVPERKAVVITQNVQEALEEAKALARPKTSILVLGGLYLGAELKESIVQTGLEW